MYLVGGEEKPQYPAKECGGKDSGTNLWLVCRRDGVISGNKIVLSTAKLATAIIIEQAIPSAIIASIRLFAIHLVEEKSTRLASQSTDLPRRR